MRRGEDVSLAFEGWLGIMVGMEILLHLLFACLKCWRVAFGLLGVVCTAWFAASLRMLRREVRLEQHFGLALPEQILDTLPLARTGFELGLIAAAAVCCWVIVRALRVLEREY